MNTQVSEHKRTLPPMPPVRNGVLRRIKVMPMLIAVVVVVMLCYPASLIGRGLVGAAYLKQGDDAMLKGRWAEAQDNFNAAMDWSLTDETAFDKRWGLALQAGDIDSAIADFSRVIAAHPNRYMGYCYRADAYREVGKEKEALQDYRACLSREPSDVWRQVAERSIETLDPRVK
ncbi:MAG TPA: tetratricopeptide repeat protein [Herpetosiphonaceae bacterium]|nr:tetratricopeptide repeat protein [Herpetosiphonaceae bacterium]